VPCELPAAWLGGGGGDGDAAHECRAAGFPFGDYSDIACAPPDDSASGGAGASSAAPGGAVGDAAPPGGLGLGGADPLEFPAYSKLLRVAAAGVASPASALLV
jgi:hypothetical protein